MELKIATVDHRDTKKRGLKISVAILCLSLVVGMLNFLTMPKFYYPGDAYAIKLSAINFVMNKDLGISFEKREKIKGFLIVKGNAFHENKEAGKYYQRWGFINTILFAIPEFFITHDEIRISDKSIFYHNCLNVLISVFIAIYLYFISALYSRSIWANLFFPLAVLYTTFYWNYLRAQSYDIFQVLFFLSFYYHFTIYQRKKSQKTSYPHLIIGYAALFLLIQIKSFYVILYFGVMFYSFLRFHYKTSLRWHDISKDFWLFLISFTITILFLLVSNKIFYGEYLFSKNASHDPYNLGIVPFSIKYYIPRIRDYFFGIPANLFIHFPLLLFSFLGMKKMIKFFKKEYIFVLIIFSCSFLVLGAFYSRGEWCYGPRFFLFILPFVSLPVIFFIEDAVMNIKNVKNLFVVTLFCTVTIFSIIMQTEVNSRHFFLRYHLENIFSGNENEEIMDYFQDSLFGSIAYDFNQFMESGEGFFPVDKLTKGATERDRLIFRTSTQKIFEKTDILKKNYYFSVIEGNTLN